MWIPEPATGSFLWKKVLLEVLQNSQENTCARDYFLITLQALGLRPFIKYLYESEYLLWSGKIYLKF